MPAKPTDAGQYAYDGLDRVLHEKARLGLLTALLPHKEGLSFTELKELCSLTDGNLARHLEKLVEGKLVSVTKSNEGKRPKTTVALTAEGRQTFLDYLTVLESIVADAIAKGNAEPVIRTA